jgi:hypothetical protein
MFASKSGVATRSIVIDSDQATSFPHAVTFDDVFDDGDDGIRRQAGVEKDRSATLGKALFANPASQQPGIVGTVSVLNVDISLAPFAVLGTLYIMTAKLVQIVHDRSP